ncbi:MAG TPA: Hpt domain-containing protein [Thermoanaerobaculia bacterium]
MTPTPTSLPPDRGSSSDSPLVDWQAFEDEYDRQQNVVERLVSTVIRTRSGDLARLRAAAGSGDIQTIGFVAHGLKTVGGLIKCQRLGDLARRTERAAVEGTGDVSVLAVDLAETLDRLLAELKTRVAAADLR